MQRDVTRFRRFGHPGKAGGLRLSDLPDLFRHSVSIAFLYRRRHVFTLPPDEGFGKRVGRITAGKLQRHFFRQGTKDVFHRVGAGLL